MSNLFILLLQLCKFLYSCLKNVHNEDGNFYITFLTEGFREFVSNCWPNTLSQHDACCLWLCTMHVLKQHLEALQVVWHIPLHFQVVLPVFLNTSNMWKQKDRRLFGVLWMKLANERKQKKKIIYAKNEALWATWISLKKESSQISTMLGRQESEKMLLLATCELTPITSHSVQEIPCVTLQNQWNPLCTTSYCICLPTSQSLRTWSQRCVMLPHTMQMQHVQLYNWVRGLAAWEGCL